MLSVKSGEIKTWKLEVLSMDQTFHHVSIGIIDASQVDPQTRVDYCNRRDNGYGISSCDSQGLNAVQFRHSEQVEVTLSDVIWKRDNESEPSEQEWLLLSPWENQLKIQAMDDMWPAWMKEESQAGKRALVDELECCDTMQVGDVVEMELDMTRPTNCTLKYKLERGGTTKHYGFSFRTIPVRAEGWRLAITMCRNGSLKLIQ